MPSKSKEAQAEYSRRHYEKNKAKVKKKVRAWNKAQAEKHKKLIRELKETTPCADCGEVYPYFVMDFHHIAEKTFDVSRSVCGGKVSTNKLLTELDKCVVLCANCHRIRTFTPN